VSAGRKRAVVVALTMVTAAVLGGCNSTGKIPHYSPATPSAVKASASANANANADAGAAAAGVRVVVAAQDADTLSVVRTERLRAKAEGRVLVVYAGAGWCEPCKRFKNAVQSGSLDDKLARTTLLVFDADRDTERLAAAGYKFQFIPYVATPGPDGHPIESAEARAKGSESWRELITTLEAWQAKGP
jgi:thiol-disulfide isomerase/thioredoxin